VAGHLLGEGTNLLLQPVGQVGRETANAEIVGGHAGAGHLFVNIHDSLPFPEAVDEDGHGADVESMAGEPDEMALEAGQLGQQDPDDLGPLGNQIGDPEQFLYRQNIRQVVVHRRQIIEAVGQGKDLVVGAVLGKLFDAAMKKTDVRYGLDDNFPVKLQHQTQHPVGRGMLRSHVYGHRFGRSHNLPLLWETVINVCD
jgi:hypothetical protein